MRNLRGNLKSGKRKRINIGGAKIEAYLLHEEYNFEFDKVRFIKLIEKISFYFNL